LRLDGQTSYTLEAAKDLCSELRRDSVQFLLDPLATQHLYRLAALARQTAVPLGIWRSLRSPGDMLAIVRSEAASHVVIDSEQLGGLAPAKACVAIATAARLSMSAGSRPSLGLATAAMLHLAAASPGLRGANESAYHQLHADILVEPLAIADGMMTVPQSPGLGVEVDRTKVEQFAVVG
jgi:L-alanine-DL-glutamate epimerase-like enolase superfamily enzyme